MGLNNYDDHFLAVSDPGIISLVPIYSFGSEPMDSEKIANVFVWLDLLEIRNIKNSLSSRIFRKLFFPFIHFNRIV